MSSLTLQRLLAPEAFGTVQGYISHLQSDKRDGCIVFRQWQIDLSRSEMTGPFYSPPSLPFSFFRFISFLSLHPGDKLHLSVFISDPNSRLLVGAAPVTLASLFDAAPERQRKARHFNSQALQLPKSSSVFHNHIIPIA